MSIDPPFKNLVIFGNILSPSSPWRYRNIPKSTPMIQMEPTDLTPSDVALPVAHDVGSMQGNALPYPVERCPPFYRKFANKKREIVKKRYRNIFHGDLGLEKAIFDTGLSMYLARRFCELSIGCQFQKQKIDRKASRLHWII